MKTYKLIALLTLLSSLAVADATIDAQIEAIINASPEERPTLVNEFKTSITTLSDDERSSAIAQLREAMQANATQTQTKTQTQTRARLNQAQETQSMEQAQKMHQHKVASQAMHQGISDMKTPMQNKFMGK